MAREKMGRRQFWRATIGTAFGGSILSFYNEPTVAQTDEAWPQSGYDASNSGHASNNTGPITDVYQRWVFDDLGTNPGTEPAVVDERVYIGGEYGLYALSTSDGTVKWTFGDRKNIEFGTPAVMDDTVFVGSPSNGIYALSAEDGTEQWRFEANTKSGLTVTDGTIYVGTVSNLYTLSADEGSEEWNFSLQFYSIGGPNSPAVKNGTVYIGSEMDDLKLYAISAEDGTQEWEYQAKTNLKTSSAVGFRPKS